MNADKADQGASSEHQEGDSSDDAELLAQLTALFAQLDKAIPTVTPDLDDLWDRIDRNLD